MENAAAIAAVQAPELVRRNGRLFIDVTGSRNGLGWWDADIDRSGAVSHSDLMIEEHDAVWTGLGRWLLIGLGIILIVLSVPVVFSPANGAAAGWNIFLGLLAIGAVASGNRKAPLLALILAALMATRLIFSIIYGAGVLALAGSLILFLIAAGAAYDLRKQTR